MRIEIIKGVREDGVAVTRRDGTSAGFAFPKKGPRPHDAFHYCVERELGLRQGFWGMVAGGMDPTAVGALAAAGGHASASRAGPPDAGIVELVQAERLVECFEAESWSGGADNAAIIAMANAGWHASLVPPIALEDAAIDAIRAAITDMARQWDALAAGQAISFEWEDRDG